MKHYCRKLLLAMTSLEADYIILGADPHDIFDSLSNVYENTCFQFEAYPIEEFTYDIKFLNNGGPSSPKVTSNAPPKLIQMPSATSQYAPSEVTSHDDYMLNTGTHESSAVSGLFEEKAIILNGAINKTNGERGGGDSYEGDEYDEDWSDERSASKLNKGSSINPNNAQASGNSINNDQQTNNTNNEYDLDSFIVEDNDEEGVDSLTASPFMLDHHHITHAYELEREQLQHATSNSTPKPNPVLEAPQHKEITRRRIAFNKKHLKYYQQYSERPITFITMLLHEAMTIDQWADESNQSISESVISPSSIPGGNSSAFSPTSRYKSNNQNTLKKNERKERGPLGFFSFILANSPFTGRDHTHHQHHGHHHGGHPNNKVLPHHNQTLPSQ